MRDPASLLPLTPVLFHVLLSLSDADRHGYAILKEVAERTDGAVTLSTGTLYGLIKRALAEGLIVESRRRPRADQDDERRRYYRLTDFGRQVVAAEARRLEQLVASAWDKRVLRRSEG
ncbi:MAG TPA: helix-turn-helix transcriptional regulator [Vicinamibacterales bacterium]|nr:helix-turn-helix transcriptional regulator [Vicinamibacterales bacterium]